MGQGCLPVPYLMNRWCVVPGQAKEEVTLIPSALVWALPWTSLT
jgi:hypothetical protein